MKKPFLNPIKSDVFCSKSSRRDANRCKHWLLEPYEPVGRGFESLTARQISSDTNLRIFCYQKYFFRGLERKRYWIDSPVDCQEPFLTERRRASRGVPHSAPDFLRYKSEDFLLSEVFFSRTRTETVLNWQSGGLSRAVSDREASSLERSPSQRATFQAPHNQVQIRLVMGFFYISRCSSGIWWVIRSGKSFDNDFRQIFVRTIIKIRGNLWGLAVCPAEWLCGSMAK